MSDAPKTPAKNGEIGSTIDWMMYLCSQKFDEQMNALSRTSK
jgi:hypothetical protein